MLRPTRPLIPVFGGEREPLSVFSKTREQQMTAKLGGLSNILIYEQTIPPQAVVGVRFPGDMNEYALFGKGLTRTVIPFPEGFVGEHPFTGPVDYVVYCRPDSGGAWVIKKVESGQTAEHTFESIKKHALHFNKEESAR
jgi:hypothetical protein